MYDIFLLLKMQSVRDSAYVSSAWLVSGYRIRHFQVIPASAVVPARLLSFQ